MPWSHDVVRSQVLSAVGSCLADWAGGTGSCDGLRERLLAYMLGEGGPSTALRQMLLWPSEVLQGRRYISGQSMDVSRPVETEDEENLVTVSHTSASQWLLIWFSRLGIESALERRCNRCQQDSPCAPTPQEKKNIGDV